MATFKHTVLVIDYGVGNHESVTNALHFLGYSYAVSSDAEDIKKADAYILPGVGAFAEAMMNLKARDIIGVLGKEVLKKKKPILGICLGMQVFAEDSVENGIRKGLGWIPGHIVRIPAHADIRIPHVGWDVLKIRTKKPLFSALPADSHFYFDHSYHFKTKKSYVSATCSYGEELTAAVQHGNIFGVQFHPEKSQNNGLRILRHFCEYAGMRPATQ